MDSEGAGRAGDAPVRPGGRRRRGRRGRPHPEHRAGGAWDGAVTDAKATFEEALGSIRDAGSAVLGRLRSMARQPDEVELKFAVKLSATAGAVIAKTAVGGQFEVKLKWLGDPAAVVGPEEPDTHTAKPDPAA